MGNHLGAVAVTRRVGESVITVIIIISNRHADSRNRLRNEKARKMYEYLIDHPCVDCGEADPIVLEFDHKTGSTKLESVTQMVINNASWQNIAAEIRKCEVRCANCHRRRTAARFGYKRFIFKEAAAAS